MPPLFEENQEAYRVFRGCSKQYKYGPSGPIDVDLQAVEIAVMRARVSEPEMVFEQVVELMRWNLENHKQIQAASAPIRR